MTVADPTERRLHPVAVIAFALLALVDAAGAAAILAFLWEAIGYDPYLRGEAGYAAAALLFVLGFAALGGYKLWRRRIAAAVACVAVPALPILFSAAALAYLLANFRHHN